MNGGGIMTVIEKLKWLTDKEEGMGIPIVVVARHSNCHPSTLGNYLRKGMEPTPRLEKMVEEGINSILRIMNEKMGE